MIQSRVFGIDKCCVQLCKTRHFKIFMKQLLATLLTIASFVVKGQNIKTLNEVSSKDTIQSGQGIIYGVFVQRLGFSSGGFPQDIRLINLDTKEIFSFRVKPTFKSAKENTFYYHIPSGNYSVLHYWWTQSKWYGGKMYTEPIFKHFAFSDIDSKLKSGELKRKELEQYKFSIQPNSLTYLGTWHFEKEIVSFSDNKIDLDEKLKDKFSRLDFKNVIITIPN